MCDFGFLVDIIGHWNELNCFQGKKTNSFTTNYDSTKGFLTKLVLWECQLKANNYSYFPALAEVSGSGVHNSEKYSNCIRTLRNLIADFLISKQEKC
jgi:hypothetical protein